MLGCWSGPGVHFSQAAESTGLYINVYNPGICLCRLVQVKDSKDVFDVMDCTLFIPRHAIASGILSFLLVQGSQWRRSAASVRVTQTAQ